MLLLNIVVSLLILALIIWLASLAMNIIIRESGLPAEAKPIALALIGILGLILIFGGYRVNW